MLPLREALEAAFGEKQELDSYAERILTAAKQLLIEHGLRRTSMADIARAASVSDRTVYNRFNDRQALLTALLVQEAVAYKTAVDDRLSTTSDPTERLVLSVVCLTQNVRGNQLLRRLLVTDPETLLPMLTTHAGRLIAYTREWVEAYAKPAPLVADPVAISEIIARLTLSLLLTPETTMSIESDEQAERFARSVLVPMLFGPPRRK